MAGEIDLVVGQVAFDRITLLLTELGKVDASFTELASKFATLGNNTNTIKNTADLAKLTAENAKLNTVIQQQSKDYDVLNSKLAQAVNARGSSTKGITEETIAQRELNKAKTLEATASNEQIGAYARLDAQHKQAVKLAQDLAVATGRTGQAYEDAKNKANEFGNKLRVVDTDIGKHTRNVGNYSSSWDGLGNSINQITREAPAFANSVATGFMALSNNLPILSDEIGVLVQKNKDLQAEGKPTTSILKTLAAGFFSWQTLISVGVTLLTVYGAKLVDMARGLGNVKEQLKLLEQAQKDSDSRISNTTRNIEAQTAIAISNAKMRGASQKELDELTLKGKKEVLLNLQKERDLAKKTEEEAIEYRKNGLKNIKTGYEEELKEAKKALAEKKKLTGVLGDDELKALKEITKKQNDEIKRIKSTGSDEVFNSIKANSKRTENEVKIAGQALNVLNKDLQAQEYEAKTKSDKKLNKEQAKDAKDQAKIDEENAKNAFERKISDLEKIAELDSDALDSFSGTLQERQMLSAKLAFDETAIAEAKYQEELRLAKGNADLIVIAENNKFKAIGDIRDENIKRVQGMYKEEEDAQAESLKEQLKKEEDHLKYLRKAQGEYEKEQAESAKRQADYLKSFADEFASKSGMSETFSMLSGQIEGFETDNKVKFVAIAEAAQEMFALIGQSSEANFQAEYERLDKQKNIALDFAGSSEVAKAKIEEDFAKKKHEIEAKQFKEKQKMAIVNIAIDTAQAIMATLGKTGIFGIPLTPILIAMGAIQSAMVLAQQPPAYAEGTDNHSGGLMLVNDGSGSNFQEKVILPSGKVIMPQGRNVLMDAPKGTKVLNHEQQLFEMLQNNNISMSTPIQNGLTYEEMNEIFQSNFANIKTQNTIFDKNGFQSYVRNGNSITRSNSNRSQAIGISV